MDPNSKIPAQFTVKDEHGTEILVTRFRDGVVTLRLPDGTVVDFNPGHPMTQSLSNVVDYLSWKLEAVG